MYMGTQGYSFYQGFTTALDTLCAQAWGAGRKQDLGVYLQRCVLLLMMATLGIGVVWGLSPQILSKIVPETEVALMAGQYLRILLIGAWVNNFSLSSFPRAKTKSEC